ncbi:hypothetical protein F4679DRAFT_584018 [Xylaria curta]|nr:hypothetical protein F4679DRAFT_584018 [Xylaria curta]
MGLGFFAMIAGIVKTPYLHSHSSADLTWELFGLFLTQLFVFQSAYFLSLHPQLAHMPLTSIETNIVIMAACVPALPKLVMRLLGKDGDSSAEQDSRRPTPTSHGDSAIKTIQGSETC